MNLVGRASSRALIAVLWIRARRNLAPPFMVPMRVQVEAFHEPSRLRVADPRSGPRLCEAQRFMVPVRAQKRRWLSMNRPSPGLRPPSPRLAGRGQGEGCQSSSWSQCIRENERGLPMNRGTSNIEHPTPNIEWHRESLLTSAFDVRCSMFDVGRSMFFLHSGASMRDQNSGDSLLEESVRVRGAPSALAASHCRSGRILDAKSESRVPSA